MVTREDKLIQLPDPPVGKALRCAVATVSNKPIVFGSAKPPRLTLPGSTIIEMMVIISLIIILALLARANFWPVADRAKRESAQVSIRALGDAALLYYQERRDYPTATTDTAVIRTELSSQVNFDNVYRGITALEMLHTPGDVVPAGQANCVQARIDAFKANNKNYWVSYCFRPDESANQSKSDFQPKCLNEDAANPAAAWVKCEGSL